VTRAHFASLYGNETVDLVRYDGSRLSALRHFATSTGLTIMVITLASFNSRNNVIYRPSEQLPGERLPFQYIQETRPVLILDEPQNMTSDRSKEALRALKPLFALRYSATHRDTPNLLYRLTPVEAFRRNLVKRIQVDAVTERDNFNERFLALERVTAGSSGITATMRTYVTQHGRLREESVTLRHRDDLHNKTGRDEHIGYVVAEISAADKFVAFDNGVRINLDEVIGPSRPDIFRVQIERTIEEHMLRQEQLLGRGIKVLSLFFIDRVANYLGKDALIRRLFDEAYIAIVARHPHFQRWTPEQVRRAYFAQRKKRGTDQPQAVDTKIVDDDSKKNAADREAERAAFDLIMRDKERLLSFDEPVCFIFAHSALKEGWDNPNVFQICTLNQTVSELRKRQEIGRGMRLPVNQNGDRVFDEAVNILTVVANESYDRFCATLQQEYVEEGFMEAMVRPSRKGEATVQRNDALFANDHFRAFWAQLARRARYHITIDTDALVAACIERLNSARFVDPVILVERAEYVVTHFAITLLDARNNRARLRIQVTSTTGDESADVLSFALRDDLSRKLHDERLQGWRIAAITEAGPDSTIAFDNGVVLRINQPFTFDTERGQRPIARTQYEAQHTYPVPNIIERAARETSLTRPTLLRIFQGLRPSSQQHVFTNPEGFSSLFIEIVGDTLRHHIVDRLTFTFAPTEAPAHDLETTFPAQKIFPQRELVVATPHGLYDRVQVDSDVETNFVTDRLCRDSKVICFFKFPPTFLVPLPRIVGNYNPDWGILRHDESGEVVLQLIRETKGTEDEARLRFSHERLKVDAARRLFRALGIDYRVVTADTANWWVSGPDQTSYSVPRKSTMSKGAEQ